MRQGHNIFGTECRVAPFNDAFQVFWRDFGGGDIQAKDLERELCVGEIFPTLLRSNISLKFLGIASKARNKDPGIE